MAGTGPSRRHADHIPRPPPRPVPPPPVPVPPWVILGRVLETDAVPAGADFVLAHAPPPAIAHLSLSPHICLLHSQSTGPPFLLAADERGRHLLVATGGGWPRPPDDSRLATLQNATPLEGLEYRVCDESNREAFKLPTPSDHGIDIGIAHPDNLGIITATGRGPGGGRFYVVAELQHISPPDNVREQKCTLLRYWSDTRRWTPTVLKYPTPARQRGSNGVIAHEGRLWWVDLIWGILSCDPFAEQPALRFVPLPLGCAVMGHRADHIEKFRCIGVSNGKLRYAQMMRDCYLAPGTPNAVKTWTLTDPDTGSWTPECDVGFAEIWADASYKDTRLPERNPALGLIHPKDPDVVYFFLDKHLFSVNLRVKRVLECVLCNDLRMPTFQRHDVSSRFVHALQFPPSIYHELRALGQAD
ncbi:uncharacterized protein LOC112270994 [Brachypodium distachyon]|uniref:DUF1618 domain-containing protein n=1 Tax=Brachypodium distachyon TaxID=15368 RepID=I1HDS6_BRADI|nr:uncharacterized protein LOC112270994 [Brachypodium distachyon]PNT70235.1 hypothetical protein BRADI_2g08450v3 [Brachypodium distachyon]PNT70236.1 hypothetical protein BRADI_2g08450v3 [Brachypodium distachyon]|eukprot:XP_024315575.1 uncharacterized protein LOC112270994 [Brachypodium distachyon]